jgi:hypothetical protein
MQLIVKSFVRYGNCSKDNRCLRKTQRPSHSGRDVLAVERKDRVRRTKLVIGRGSAVLRSPRDQACVEQAATPEDRRH